MVDNITIVNKSKFNETTQSLHWEFHIMHFLGHELCGVVNLHGIHPTHTTPYPKEIENYIRWLTLEYPSDGLPLPEFVYHGRAIDNGN